MVALDLVDPAGRLTVFADRPDLMVVPGAILVAHIAGLCVLLWQLRLRASAPFQLRLDLATLLPLVLTAISVASILVVTGVLISQIGRPRSTRSSATSRRSRTSMPSGSATRSISRWRVCSRSADAGRSSSTGWPTANASYPAAAADRRVVLADREHTWETSPDSSDFVLQYRNNPVALELSRFRGEDLLHNDVILTDAAGGLVAAQGEKPAHFSFADAPWWQAAWNDSVGGVYLGDLTMDPERGTASVFIAVSVLNPQTNEMVGVLASTYDLSGVQRDIGLANDQLDAAVLLLSPDGRIIAGTEGQDVGRPVDQAQLAGGAGGTAPGPDSRDVPVVEARSPITATAVVNRDALQALGLQISVSDSEANALAEVTRSTEVATLVGLLAIALGVIAATAAARPITRPIEALTSTAAAIAAGDLEQRASPAGPAELSTLAEAFNTLTGRLRALINGLQDQVAQRTGQLEARVEQLATLNRIDPDRVLDA